MAVHEHGSRGEAQLGLVGVGVDVHLALEALRPADPAHAQEVVGRFRGFGRSLVGVRSARHISRLVSRLAHERSIIWFRGTEQQSVIVGALSELSDGIDLMQRESIIDERESDEEGGDQPGSAAHVDDVDARAMVAHRLDHGAQCGGGASGAADHAADVVGIDLHAQQFAAVTHTRGAHAHILRMIHDIGDEVPERFFFHDGFLASR